jgi:hypothetical protein
MVCYDSVAVGAVKAKRFDRRDPAKVAAVDEFGKWMSSQFQGKESRVSGAQTQGKENRVSGKENRVSGDGDGDGGRESGSSLVQDSSDVVGLSEDEDAGGSGVSGGGAVRRRTVLVVSRRGTRRIANEEELLEAIRAVVALDLPAPARSSEGQARQGLSPAVEWVVATIDLDSIPLGDQIRYV